MQRYSLRFSSWMSLLTTSSFTHRISWYKNVAEQKMCFYSCSEFQNLVARNKNICFRFVYHQYSDRRHMVQFKFWWLSVAILGLIYFQTFWNVLVCTSQSRGFKPMYQLLNKGVLFLFLIRTRLFLRLMYFQLSNSCNAYKSFMKKFLCCCGVLKRIGSLFVVNCKLVYRN